MAMAGYKWPISVPLEKVKHIIIRSAEKISKKQRGQNTLVNRKLSITDPARCSLHTLIDHVGC